MAGGLCDKADVTLDLGFSFRSLTLSGTLLMIPKYYLTAVLLRPLAMQVATLRRNPAPVIPSTV